MSNPWDERYSVADYVYGTEPNDYLREQMHRIAPGGRVLCIADGEGRNGVYLAQHGFDVTSIDASRVGLDKAQALAAVHHVAIATIHSDLADYDFGIAQWMPLCRYSVTSHLISARGFMPQFLRHFVAVAL